MPGWLLRCYVAMLPRLEAERELAAVRRGHAFTDRPMEDRSHREYMRQLRDRAQPDRKPEPVSWETLAGFGIIVERVGEEGNSG